MKKTIVSLICTLALCLGLLPTAALAAGDAPATLYVGETQITASGYWTTDTNGKLAAGNANNYNVYYDGSGTLTLNNANIQGGNDSQNPQPKDYGIYAAPTGGQSVSLTINLIGSNTVGGHCGICVEAKTGDYATLVIQSNGNDPKGSLEASGSSWNGISVSATQGNASLTINNASVEASSGAQYYHGVSLISYTASNPKLSLTVNGGSLTAQGYYGIWYNLGSATNSSTSLTVSDSALIKGIPNISASGASKPTPQGDGIVFDGTEGTVYGDVTLQDDLTVGKGETLTIPEGSSLDTNGKLTNSGTVTIENGGTLTGADTITNSGTINVEKGGKLDSTPTGGTVVKAPTITTTALDEGTVGTEYSQPLVAENNPTNWSVTIGNLPAGLTLDKTTGTISGTPNAAGTFDFTVTAANSAGSISKAFTLKVNQPVTSVTLTPTTLSLVEGETDTLTATVEPDDATNPAVTWSSNAETVATVTQDPKDGTKATVTALKAGEATITATAVDGSQKSASCTVKVEPKTYQISIDQPTLDFGSMFAGNSVPGAQTVTVTNKGNQDVTVALPASTYYNVTAGTGFTDGNAVIEPGKTATFTVQPKTGLAAGTYQETLTVSGGNGAQAALFCKLTVTVKTYSMSIDPGAIGFGNVQVGYNQPAVKEVVVKNTGNQTLTLTQPTANNYQVGSLNQFTVAPGDTAIFTVQPKAGLLSGTYNETVVVAASGAQSVSVSLTFSVGSPVTSGTATTEKRTLHFDTNGGLPLDDVVRGLGAPVELWPYTPVRAGYLFQGWYSDQALTKAVSSVVLTKDTTIYAKWAVDPAAAAAQSSSSGSGSSGKGSGSGSSGKGSGSTTVTVTPSPTVTPTPAPTATPTPEPTATPESSAEPETDANAASFPVIPVAAGVIVLVVLVGGIVIFRRFRD